MDSLRGMGAIVTGGTRGIGREIARQLLDAGVEVAICGRRRDSLREALEALANVGRVVGARCDVSSWADADRFFEFADSRLPRLDILVNNAGIGRFAAVDELSRKSWLEVIGTNLNGAFFFTRLAVPRMKLQGGGFILNIGSLAGKHAFASGAAYNASKFGLAGFTEACMLDLRDENIRVSTIMPGSVQTGFSSGIEGADWKLDPAAVASMALHLIRTPARNLASRVEMRPSRVRKR